ncbi:MAG TPA: hypothetical protein VKM93_21975 [Terriglobia bacterium]|nr:hypothetical protein [Terriglobia bacterium]
MSLYDAIQTYHELLTNDLAGESQAQLDDQLQRRGLFFGDRPLCTVLRPRFLTHEQYRYLQTRCGLLLRAFDKIYRAAIADKTFRSQFGLSDWEEELVQYSPGYRDASPTSRLDAFFVPGTGELRFTEYNAETPAGVAYNDSLSEVFYGLRVMREFLRKWDVRPLLARHNVVHALLDAYHQWTGRREAPRIAIVDWREVPTYSEFTLFAEYIKSQGLECVIVDPRETEYTGGHLYAHGTPINMIYKRVLLSELYDRGGMDQPVFRAVREGAVAMVNSFRCKILHKKSSLAVLSDERHAGLFTADEIEAIDAHIPWTRRVEERRTVYRHSHVDLVPFVAEHRDWFVLKPNDEYGGKGIVLGWLTPADEWERNVKEALAAPYVVQERATIPKEAFPSMVNGRVEFIDRILDTNPYVFYGDYVDGCLTRLSTAALVNVTAGGGSSVATFLAEKR